MILALGLIRSIGLKGLAIVGIAAAVLFTAIGLYRAGAKAERMSNIAAMHGRLRADLKTKEKIRHAISTDDDGGDIADKLFNTWRR